MTESSSNSHISCQELFEALQSTLRLSRFEQPVSTKPTDPTDYADESVTSSQHLSLRNEHYIPLVGYLNLIHANDIQIIGTTESDYLNQLDHARQIATIQDLANSSCKIIAISSDLAANEAITSQPWWQQLRRIDRPVWTTALPAFEIISTLEQWLSQRLLPRMSMHGVFMNVLGMGVLITGASGIGKSELALELITRGHSLVADDMVEFTRTGNRVIGSCPDILQDFLEVRGLGVVNIRAMFGAGAIRTERTLRLIIHLESMPIKGLDRVAGARSDHNILGNNIPEITLPVTVGRNIAVLVETAVRDHLLRTGDGAVRPIAGSVDAESHSRGYQADQELIERQAAAMLQQTTGELL